MNRDVYAEIIADPFHLHPMTVDLIFRIKDPGRIIIVSDSVAGTRKDGGMRPQALDDRHGTLIGGACSVVAAARNLIDRGFPEDDIMKTITENPGRYLAS
jgi:N-acetylglucosamine-6-phosphate deacetylase